MMRHADSEDSCGPGLRDHDRAITALGREAAARVAQELHDRGWVPDLIVCSNAMRTKQTLETMRDAVKGFAEAEALFLGSLYTVAALDGQTRRHLQQCIIDAVKSSAATCVMCLGHNKGWEEAATSFTGTEVRLQPASAALMEQGGDTWQDALSDAASWRLVEVVLPPGAQLTGPQAA